MPDGPSVREAALPTPYDNVSRETGGELVGRGLQQLGAGLEQAAERARQARVKADSIRIADAETALQRAWQRRLHGSSEGGESVPGFFSTKGVGAAEASSELYEGLDEDKERVAESLSQEQRRVFEQRARALRLDVARRVESHVAGQRDAAAEASLRARTETALNEIASNFADEETVATQMAALRAPIRALQLSPEDGAAKELRLEQEVARIRLNGFLGANDWKGAEALFARVKEKLGPQAVTIEKSIKGVKRNSVAEEEAIKAIEGARGEDRRVNGDLALASLDAIQDVEVRDEARRRTQERVLRAEQAWAKETDQVEKSAHALYDKGGWGAIPYALTEELRVRSPAYWQRLREDGERRWRQRKQDASEARREQAMRDREALLHFMARPPEERVSADVGKEYGEVGLSIVGLREIQVRQRQAIDQQNRGLQASETEFLGMARSSAQGVVKGKDNQKAFDAEARLEFARLEQQLKRTPSREEAKAAIGELLKEGLTKDGWFGRSSEMEWQRRARSRKEGGGEPAQPATAPSTPAAAPSPGAPPALLSKPSKAERVLQLNRQKLSPAEIVKVLQKEGY